MKRSRPFTRTKNLKINAIPSKISPEVDHLSNSIKGPITEMNHVSPVMNRLSGAFLNQNLYKDEDIPLRPISGQEKLYNAIG